MITMQRLFMIAATAGQLAVSACSTTKPSAPNAGAPRPVAKEHVRTVYSIGDDLRRVRTPEYVKTYHLGRRPSRSGNLMSEAHRVYRLEKSSRWNLARSNPPLDGNAPTTRIVDQSFRPLPENGQIRAEIARQRELTAEIEQARDRLTATIAEARDRFANDQAREAKIAELSQEIVRLQEMVTAGGNPAEPDGEGEDQSASRTKELQEWGERQDKP